MFWYAPRVLCCMLPKTKAYQAYFRYLQFVVFGLCKILFLVAPVLFPRHTCEAARENTIDLLHMFRDYLHYHIKCSKVYVHSRMRAKAGDLLKVLNRARPQTNARPAERKTIT